MEEPLFALLSTPLVILNSCAQERDCGHLDYKHGPLSLPFTQKWLLEIETSSVLVPNVYY